MSAIADAWGRLAEAGALARLEARYCEPWRAYHVWAHPRAMELHLEAAEAAGVRIHDAHACVAFVGWHDAFYDPQAVHGRNEELSALLLEAEGPLHFRAKSVARGCSAIRATVTHQPVPGVECPDIEVLLDVDLSILGADPGLFDDYDRRIRTEYGHVPDEIYRPARAGVLERFLGRDRLFLTEWGHALWEERARLNLEAAIDHLKTGA